MITRFGGRSSCAALIAALAFEPAAGQQLRGLHPPATVPAAVLLDTTGLFRDRFAKVGDDVFITGQPTERGLRELKARGVTTVVNLRTPEEMKRSVPFDEPALVSGLGMRYVYLPVRGDTAYPYTPAVLDRFADVMAHADGKLLLHCTVAWRASHLWAAYLIRERKVPEGVALTNARGISLMDDMRMSAGRQPIEGFLDRDLPGLLRGRTPPPPSAPAPPAAAGAPDPNHVASQDAIL